MNKKLLLFITIITSSGMGIYAYLGGFNSPEISIIKSEKQFIVGKYYAGPPENEAFGQLFRQAADLQKSKKLKGALANIYYNNPQQQGDSIKAFIGLLITNPSDTIPAGYEIRELPANKKILQVQINTHYMLAPGKLYDALFGYIKKHRLQTRNQFVELFLEGNKSIVQTELK